jgi:phosphatidylethanolamine/phosphatidyl-N-methylethanolamine N-methyltransferase
MAQRNEIPSKCAADDQASECARAYDRIAPIYDLLDGFYEWSWKRGLRCRLFRHARGRLLDVGVGTGRNIPFYPTASAAVGIDASPAMLARAAERARKLGRTVELREMSLLDLHFPDASFDTVAVTFVLLCLPSKLQQVALAELKRVTRPDGQILLLDYRLSERTGMRLWMRALSPWLRWAFAASYDPQTERFVEASGLVVLERHRFMADGVGMLVLRHAPERPSDLAAAL